MIRAMTSIIDIGEAVDVDTVALTALKELEQAALAHRGVIFILNNRGLGVVVCVTFLVPMKHQTVVGQSHGQEVIGDEQIQDVVLVVVVLVYNSIRIISLFHEIIDHILHRNVEWILPQLGRPECIRLGKEGISVVAVLGHFSCGVADT